MADNQPSASATTTVADSSQSSALKRRMPYALLVLAIVLILGGGIVANVTQTNGGSIAVRQVHFAGNNGTMMSGLLYVPATATAKTPACGIVAIHGYINSHDTMDGFSIEMARRGCVVLAADQTGHGGSDAPAFANGYGGPDALAYINSLDFVKAGNIGLIGHSMGGWASVIAAGTLPTAYQSVALISSSTSTPPLEPIPGTAEFPRNTAVIEAQYSEFSSLMWGVPRGTDFPTSERLEHLFGTSAPVEAGHLYGSPSSGTAREFFSVPTTHPGMTFNSTAIGDAISWEQQTLTGVSSLPPTDQIWIWDEIGTLLALIGVILLLFPVGTLLLRSRFFGELAQPMPEGKPMTGIGFWVGGVLLAAIGVFSFFQFQIWGNQWLPASQLFPQTITTGIMVWAVGGALIGLVLFLIFHFGSNRRQGARLSNYGITGDNNRLEPRRIGKAFLFAVLVVASMYLALGFLGWAFNTDARIWVFNAKPLDRAHFRIALGYLIPFAFYFVMLGVILHGELRAKKASFVRDWLLNILILAGGFVVFLLVEYVPLLSGGTLFTADQPLLAIVAFQFVPVYVIVASISTYFYHRTGRIWTGAFINALLVTGLIVASTATQFPVGY